MKQKITRAELAAKFAEGMERKKAERERFLLLALEHPDRMDMYTRLTDYLELDIRYYGMARAYYADDIESLDTGDEEDLLFLTQISEPPPRVYAQYLREVDPSARADERITHAALMELKVSMGQVLSRS